MMHLPLGSKIRRRMGDGSSFVVLVEKPRRPPRCGVVTVSEHGTEYRAFGDVEVTQDADGTWS